MGEPIKANADNDLLFRDTMKKKKKKTDEQIDESVNQDEQLEYFTE